MSGGARPGTRTPEPDSGGTPPAALIRPVVGAEPRAVVPGKSNAAVRYAVAVLALVVAAEYAVIAKALRSNALDGRPAQIASSLGGRAPRGLTAPSDSSTTADAPKLM